MANGKLDSLRAKWNGGQFSRELFIEEFSAILNPSIPQKTAEVDVPDVKDAEPPAVKKSKKGGVTYKASLQLKAPDKSASSGDAAASSDLGEVSYTKLKIGYEDGVVKTAQ